MGELRFSFLARRNRFGMLWLAVLLVASTLSIIVLGNAQAGAQASGAQTKGDCSEDQEAIDAFIAEVQAAYVTCSDGKATEVNVWWSLLGPVPPEIGGLKHLKKLELYDIGVTELPPEIGNLTELTYLDLNENSISVLPPEIGKLTKLQTLHAADNPLSALPPEFANLVDMRELTLAIGGLSTFPPEITQLRELTDLDLRDNKLTSVPATIGNLTKLETLDLGMNALNTLPPEMAKLTNLRALWLPDVGLTTLGDEVLNLTKLETLDLEMNALKTLPPEIANLTNLTNLYVEGNKLTALPDEITNLKKLERLLVGDNQLRSLPLSIGNMSSIWEFDVAGNKLESLPVDARRLIGGRFGDPFGNSLYDSGLPIPYVAIGACTTGSPQLIAVAPRNSPSSVAKSIQVNGRTYQMSQPGSTLSTTQLKRAGSGPTFSVELAGRTQTVQCEGNSSQPNDVLASEVFIARSCQARNGRIDFNIVNTQSTALYRVEVSGLKTRERSIQSNKTWRVPITGRPDGSYKATVTKTVLSDNTTQTLTKTFNVDCDKKAPTQLSEEFQMIPYCVAGKGAIRYQFVNPTKTKRTYVVKMKGVRDLRVAAPAFGAASNRVAKLSDGRITAKVEYADRPGVTVHRKTVKIACANS